MDPPPVIRTNGMEMGRTAGPPDTTEMEARISTVATKPEDMETVAEDGHLTVETVEAMDPPPVIRTNGMAMGTTAGLPDTMAMEARITTVATKPEDMETVAEDGHLMLETGVTEDGVNETEW